MAEPAKDDTAAAEAAAAEADATAAAAAAAAATKNGDDASSWRESITDADELKNSQRFESPADINRAHMDLRRRNSAMIPVIDDKSSEEDVAKFRKKIGASTEAADYTGTVDWKVLGKDYKPSEADEAYAEAMAGSAISAGVPVSAFKSFAEAHIKILAEANAAGAAEVQKVADEQDAALHVEWGSDYEVNKGVATAARQLVAAEIGVKEEDIQDILNAELKHASIQLGNTVVAMKLFSWLGHRLSEDGAIGGADAQSRVKSIDEQIGAIEEKIADGSVTKKEMTERKDLIDQKDKLTGVELT